MTITDDRPWITVRDAAERMGKTPDQVRRLVRAGKLPAGRSSQRGHFRLRPEVVEAYLRQPGGNGSA